MNVTNNLCEKRINALTSIYKLIEINLVFKRY